jgi:hypothetical protein
MHQKVGLNLFQTIEKDVDIWFVVCRGEFVMIRGPSGGGMLSIGLYFSSCVYQAKLRF